MCSDIEFVDQIYSDHEDALNVIHSKYVLIWYNYLSDLHADINGVRQSATSTISLEGGYCEATKPDSKGCYMV